MGKRRRQSPAAPELEQEQTDSLAESETAAQAAGSKEEETEGAYKEKVSERQPVGEVPAEAGEVSQPVSGEAAASEPAAPGGLVEPPEQAVERLTAELEDLRDRHLRLAAEFDNFRKRMQRERAETWTRAQAAVVAALLDVLDDLGRVVGLDPAGVSVKDILEGVGLVERKLVRALESAGLERVGASGEAFDPNVHEAVGTAQASSAEQDHVVAEVLQPGYRFGGVLLRPARVSVYVWSGEPSPDGGGES
ncbi:Protein GrpE [bacterium HR33]|nr:Protein GrpE [bacterium HR33]